MSEIVQGGTTANKNGKIFEDTLIPLFKNHGYNVIQNKDLEYFYEEESDKYVILMHHLKLYTITVEKQNSY